MHLITQVLVSCGSILSRPTPLPKPLRWVYWIMQLRKKKPFMLWESEPKNQANECGENISTLNPYNFPFESLTALTSKVFVSGEGPRYHGWFRTSCAWPKASDGRDGRDGRDGGQTSGLTCLGTAMVDSSESIWNPNESDAFKAPKAQRPVLLQAVLFGPLWEAGRSRPGRECDKHAVAQQAVTLLVVVTDSFRTACIASCDSKVCSDRGRTWYINGRLQCVHLDVEALQWKLEVDSVNLKKFDSCLLGQAKWRAKSAAGSFGMDSRAQRRRKGKALNFAQPSALGSARLSCTPSS